jgi:Na+/H+ antiporter NhaD/arsenite permease-like protein
MYAGTTIKNAAIGAIFTDTVEHIKNRKFTVVVTGVFLATILAMSFRQFTGLHLGFIAVTGMILLVLITEIFRKKLESPGFEQIISELDWRTLFFYITLFILVGGINHAGLIAMVANALAVYIQNSPITGTIIVYWTTAPIAGIVEHDAYILGFLYLIQDMAAAANISPWPLWWAVLWAGTLGSNLTIAGAPALLVSQNICEREDSCKIGMGQFFSFTLPFVLITLVICFILALFIWFIPFTA